MTRSEETLLPILPLLLEIPGMPLNRDGQDRQEIMLNFLLLRCSWSCRC